VHHEFVPAGGINAAFYVQVLKRLRCVRPESWTEKNLILHHNNAPSHTAFIMREFIAKNNISTIDYPRLFVLWFFLFSKMKMIIRSEYFGDVENIKRETTKFLKDLSKNDM